MSSHATHQHGSLRASILIASLIFMWVCVWTSTRVYAHDTPTQPTPTYHRAISLTPHITELVYAAGAGDRLVGTVNSSNYPAKALELPRIGDGMSLNNEKLLRLRPDLIIAWRESQASQLLSPAFRKLDVEILTSSPNSLLEIADEVARFGTLFDTQAYATPAAEALRARITTLQQRYAHSATVSVFLEVGTDPLYSMGNDPLWADALATCGAVNFYADSIAAAPQASVEDILYRQPQLVLSTAKTIPQQQERLQYWQGKHLPAALAGHVYFLDADALYRPGPRLIDAVEQLCVYTEQVRQHTSPPAR